MRLSLRLIALLICTLFAGAIGIWLGRKTSPYGIDTSQQADLHGHQAADQEPEPSVAPPEPPLYFLVNTGTTADLLAVLEEVHMAAEADMHRFVITVPLPWDNDPASMEIVYNRLQLLMDASPGASVLLWISLDPPETWLAGHPDDMATVGPSIEPYACVASPQWLADAKRSLERLIHGIEKSPYAEQVVGYIPACLENGCWFRKGGYDACGANTAGFRRWLGKRYSNDGALHEAWADTEVTLATASVPPQLDTADTRQVFFTLPHMQRYVDYLRYVSESTAEAIAAIAAYIKERAGKQTQVFVPYGYSFELLESDAGHFALEKLLESAVDGFVSPVSYVDRGLGGVGGFMGPIHSASYHGKQWFIIDDTRTGIFRDTSTGRPTLLPGIRKEDIYAVHERNFAAALTQGLGLLWADFKGDGALCDTDMWKRFASMRDAYKSADTAGEDVWDTLAGGRDILTLSVVVDETSRFYQQCDVVLNESLLRDARDCALRVGVPTHFCLMSDLLTGKAADAAVYLFVNTFVLTEQERAYIQKLLATEKAAAIWLYAPGYIADIPSVENITATTGIATKAFEGPAQAGSVYQLRGNWIAGGHEFGASGEWAPLFYIDDPETDVLASYGASDKPSVAIRFLNTGWSSVYIAEPALSVELLREILDILEQPLLVRDTSKPFYDTTHFGRHMLALHAREAGHRVLDLGQAYDVRDLFDPTIGWTNKRTIAFPLKSGETRLFQLTPAQKGSP